MAGDGLFGLHYAVPHNAKPRATSTASIMPNAGTSDLKLQTLASSGVSGNTRVRPLRVWPMTLTVLAAAMAVTLLMLALAALQYHAQIRSELRDQLLGTSRVLEEHAAKVLGIHAATLKHVEWMVDDLGWERIAGSPLLQQRLVHMAEDLPEVQSYWITDETGVVRATSQEWPVRALKVADREYFRIHAEGRREIHVGPRLLGRIRQNEVFFTVSHRMEKPDGSFQGVAQVSILPSYFSAFYRSALARPGDVILLLREDGSVLAREPAGGAAGDPTKADIGRYPELISAPETDGIFRIVTAFDGVERLMVRRKVPDMPVYVAYGIDTATLTDEWRSRVAPYVYFAGPVAILLLVMGVIALRRSREVALAQRQLRQANDELEQRIAERTRHLDRALADKEVLLRDIHHRVKNNLQVILSLLQLQSQRLPALKPHFDEALARIHTMGLIHEQIYRSTGVSEVRLDEFVAALCGNLRSFYDRPERTVRISHDADPVVLDLNRAVPFSLILNEVVSNAYKHGFRDRSEGEIRIIVREEGDRIHLTIHDDGVGMPEEQPKRKSMGMDLIRAFARQLGGSHAFSNDGGTRFDLAFPKAAAEA